MSYTPTEWESTDVVTATRMNALEQAVGDMNMSYTPNVWSDGDILSAEKMNALEQAVASGGGGSSDFSTAEVTVKLVGEPSLATFDIYLTDLLTGDANGLVVIEEDDIRYLTTDSQVIELEKPSQTEAEKIIYLYKNNPVYVAWRLAQSTSDYTIMGSGEAVALDVDGTLIYAVKVTGDCTITIS